MLILAPLVLVARVPPRREVVDEWLEVQRSGDVDRMMDALPEEPVLDLHFGGGYRGAGPARQALEWRAATGSAFEVEREIENDDADGRLALLVRERSRVYDLLGHSPRYEMFYYVRGRGVSAELAVRGDRETDAALADSLAAFAAWLEPAERAALFADGRPRWTGETAGPWLDRLAAWRAAR